MRLSLIHLPLLAVLIGLQPLVATAHKKDHYGPRRVSPVSGPSLIQPSPGYPSLGGPSVGYPSLGGPSIGYPSLGGPSIGYPALGGPSIGYPSVGRPSTGYPGISYSPQDVEAYIREWYLKYIGREPEPAGMQSWLDQFYYGSSTLAQVQVGIMSSPECFARCHHDPSQYVQFLIFQITGRQAAPQELQTWVTLFHQRYFGDRAQFCRDLINTYG